MVVKALIQNVNTDAELTALSANIIFMSLILKQEM
jgi:hypothetical protein